MYYIITDIHSCFEELEELLALNTNNYQIVALGDYIDRGNYPVETLKKMMSITDNGGIALLGNHDDKLMRALKGNKVKIGHGLGDTLDKLYKEPKSFQNDVLKWLEERPYKAILDSDNLIVAHAGLKEDLQDKDSKKAKSFALYGDVENKDEMNAQIPEELKGIVHSILPKRKDWAQEYSGRRWVVHGHTPMLEPRELNKVVCIDTKCFGGFSLTALEYLGHDKDKTFKSIKAKKVYYENN